MPTIRLSSATGTAKARSPGAMWERSGSRQASCFAAVSCFRFWGLELPDVVLGCGVFGMIVCLLDPLIVTCSFEVNAYREVRVFLFLAILDITQCGNKSSKLSLPAESLYYLSFTKRDISAFFDFRPYRVHGQRDGLRRCPPTIGWGRQISLGSIPGRAATTAGLCTRIAVCKFSECWKIGKMEAGCALSAMLKPAAVIGSSSTTASCDQPSATAACSVPLPASIFPVRRFTTAGLRWP